ncbi:MAG: dCTP deaminase [Armatimonadota bacterium]
MIKSDNWIKEMSLEHGMIKPFAPEQIRDGNISYGLSSYGYDIRISDEFEILDISNKIEYLDPKNTDKPLFKKIKTKEFIIPANSFVLARSLEYFKIPRNVITACFGKSTYARSGIIVNVTPFEPHWEGFATMCIANTAPVPVKIYAGEGIAQLLFFESDESCITSYADKKGKYQAQKNITHSKV